MPTQTLKDYIKNREQLEKIETFVKAAADVDIITFKVGELVKTVIPDDENAKINPDDAELIILELSKLVFIFQELSHEIVNWFGDILSEIATDMGLLENN